MSSPARAGSSAYTFDRGYPTPDTTLRAREDGDLQRAIVAYRYWYPAVSNEGIFNGNRAVGIRDNEGIGIAACGPRQVGFTLNSDTPYASGVLDVSQGPMVVELPPGAYVGLVNDHYQGWVLDMGLPGPDAGKGGKHLVLPPGHDGDAPAGHHAGHSKSMKNLLAVRALPIGGDVAKAMEALRAIKVYPLARPEDPVPTADTSQTKMDSSCLTWETNIQFWEKLHGIVSLEPLVSDFLPMYGLLSSLGIEKGREFPSDHKTRDLLERAAKAGRDELLVSAFDSARPDRINWPDRKWEWVGLVPDSAQFETPRGIDLEARDRWFAQAIVTSPAMFRRTAGAGSLYWMSTKDATGTFLDGGRSYRLNIPQPVPGKLFWSVTVYDTATRSQVQTDQDKAALRSMFELRDVARSSSIELYFGPTAAAGREGRWIKTVPGKGWFAYIRIYGPEQAAFDKSWKPGDFEPTA
jgi:hypothetical protein